MKITKIKDPNTEQAILGAAEEVFLEKGFAAARTTEIARLAGVNHAMLHYYYRTKENLFDKVFDQKLQLLNNSFSTALERGMPFPEKIRLAVATHFDFLAANPRLPFFILNEVIVNPDRKKLFKELLLPKIQKIFHILEIEIKEEIKKGTVRSITPGDLLMHMGSLNAASIVAALVIYEKSGDEETEQAKQEFLNKRKQENIEFITKGLRP